MSYDTMAPPPFLIIGSHLNPHPTAHLVLQAPLPVSFVKAP